MTLHENATTADLDHFVEQLPMPLRARLAAACIKPHLGTTFDMSYDEDFAGHFVGELRLTAEPQMAELGLLNFVVGELA
jgi:hypothetical protein